MSKSALEQAVCMLRILEILRDQPKPPRLLHASSREILGTPEHSPQDESAPIHPESPYGVAKAFATQPEHSFKDIVNSIVDSGLQKLEARSG